MGNFMAQHSGQSIVVTTDGKYATENKYLAPAFTVSRISTLCLEPFPTEGIGTQFSSNDQMRTHPGITKAFFSAAASITLTSHLSPSNPLAGISL